MPCGKAIIPAPKLLTSLPDSSKRSTGLSGDILPVVGSATHVFAPHRSATQIERPSRATSTALVDPQVRPSGILKWPSIVSNGFGASLVGAAAVCAYKPHPPPATRAATAADLNRDMRVLL